MRLVQILLVTGVDVNAITFKFVKMYIGDGNSWLMVYCLIENFVVLYTYYCLNFGSTVQDHWRIHLPSMKAIS